MPDAPEKAEAEPKKKFAEFLESTPPDGTEEISDLCQRNAANYEVAAPDLQLHCESCGETRVFDRPSGSISLPSADKWYLGFMNYICRTCRKSSKVYALMVLRPTATDSIAAVSVCPGRALKLGEHPSFGRPVPSRLIALIGPDRELFLCGRRAENQGLGIGAFAYYRRVVENQKGRIITEIGKVAERLGAGSEVLSGFAKAATETQFSRAIDEVKVAMPDGLLIHGQNPLTLLHSALSEGVHEQTDAGCLELAKDIRIVLTELADRISQALKDQGELNEAVKRLLNRKTGEQTSIKPKR
jgi:hypothetical protein